jgi:hypothetical protein
MRAPEDARSSLPAASTSLLDGALSRAAFRDYFCCHESFAAILPQAGLSTDQGYFRFGGAICYGRRSGNDPNRRATDGLADLSHAATFGPDGVALPFDLVEVLRNLREERYPQEPQPYIERITGSEALRHFYYFVRPVLPVGLRRHIQKIRLGDWRRILFPAWPVDVTVETLMESVMALVLKNRGEIPFIWFWPDGAKSALVVTHDVEGAAGGAFCGTLMTLDESFGIRSSFQIVPEGRRTLACDMIERIRQRGFEVNVHDLNHDGHLFDNHPLFLERAARINAHARRLRSKGFRTGAVYRELQWFDALDFSYDMSVPNAAHLEPQRGGCCTVMPYFLGKMVELPLTTVQDYSLFHILGDYTIGLWQQQTEMIMARHGLITVLTHPDYLIDERARAVYAELLGYMQRLQTERGAWMALPSEVDQWWRNRQRMTLVPEGRSWRIEGQQSDRASLAFARLEGDRVVYRVEPGHRGSGE